MSSKWQPTDNSDNGEKVEIRRRLLKALGAEPAVLDCFAGEGKIYSKCYKGHEYLGLDKKDIQDGRNILNVDNIKYLRSADLGRFNFFDLDAYGSPWRQFLTVLKRRRFDRGARVAMAITDGLQFNMSMSELPAGMKPYVGLPRRMKVPELHRHQDFIRQLIVTQAIAEAALFIRLSLIARNPRGNMTYLGLMLEKP